MILNIFKFIAVLASGTFAFFALLGDNRKNGKLTRWGRIAIAGVITSTLVAVITQGIEARKEQQNNAETRAMVTDIRRAAYPVLPPRPPGFAYMIEIPLNLPSLAHYRERLRSMTDSLRGHPDEKTNWLNTTATLVHGISGAPEVGGLRFTAPSPAFPTAESEPALLDWVTHLGIEIKFYKRGTVPTRFREQPPELELDQVSPIASVTLTYDRNLDTLEIEGKGGLRDENNYYSTTTGQMMSLTDLASAEMLILYPEASDETLVDEQLKMENASALSSLWIEIANRQFFIGKFKPIRIERFTVYTFTLPSDLVSSSVVDLTAAQNVPK
jgi:hypothetical protein